MKSVLIGSFVRDVAAASRCAQLLASSAALPVGGSVKVRRGVLHGRCRILVELQGPAACLKGAEILVLGMLFEAFVVGIGGADAVAVGAMVHDAVAEGGRK